MHFTTNEEKIRAYVLCHHALWDAEAKSHALCVECPASDYGHCRCRGILTPEITNLIVEENIEIFYCFSDELIENILYRYKNHNYDQLIMVDRKYTL